MRRRTSILLVASVLLLLGAVTGVGAWPAYEIFYTVRYSCIISPSYYGYVVGEWKTDCNNNTTGWGWEPGHNCTMTDVTYGAACYGGGGGEGPGGPENPAN